jgi:hypothetical protein
MHMINKFKGIIGIFFAFIFALTAIGVYLNDYLSIYACFIIVILIVFYIIIEIIKIIGENEEEEEMNYFLEIQAEAFLMILKDVSLAQIVLQFYRKYNLPSWISLLFYSNSLKEQLIGGNRNILSHARDYISHNKIKCIVKSKKCLNLYNFQNHVFKLEEAVYCYDGNPEENIGEEGLLILHRNYLYFFHSKYYKDEIKFLNKIIDFLGLFNEFVDDSKFFYEKIKQTTNPLIPYFNKNDVDKLLAIWDEHKGIAIPLRSIISAKTVFIHVKKSYCLQLEVKHGHEIKNYWLETLDTKDINWCREWIDSLSLIQILNGSTNIIDNIINHDEQNLDF